jgi:hypothetical protein
LGLLIKDKLEVTLTGGPVACFRISSHRPEGTEEKHDKLRIVSALIEIPGNIRKILA